MEPCSSPCRPILFAAAILSLLFFGCEADGRDKAADEISDAGETDSDTDSDTGSDTGSEPEDEDCAGISEKARNGLSPVDIIFAVDNSGSMTQEAAFVQENMNHFSQQIIASGVNAQIILISKGALDDNGICVEPPLGSGECPEDANPPTYYHLYREVGSSDSLLQLSASYIVWKNHLRINSVRHVVVVSDDNSDGIFGSAQWFINAMSNKSPPFDDFTFHAIVSSLEPDVACQQDPPHPCCELSASRGMVYEKLVEKTEGVLADLCEQDFQPVFDKLAEVMADVPIACEWELPPPPKGQDLDPEKVNVDFTDGNNNINEIGYVESAEDCPGVEHGWYYDEPQNPEKIYACPQTCKWIQADLNAAISIKFGCSRKAAAPV